MYGTAKRWKRASGPFSADSSRIDSAMLAQRLLRSDRQGERFARAFGVEQSGVRFAHDAIREKSELLFIRIPVRERNLLPESLSPGSARRLP